MLFTFLKKQKEKSHKVEVIRTLIFNLNIPEEQKEIFISALDILEVHELDSLYTEITVFTETLEMKQISDIKKDSFMSVGWMKKKEVEEKQKEVNAFAFLINNI